MADDKADKPILVFPHAELLHGRFEFFQENKQVIDMTAEAASALVKIETLKTEAAVRVANANVEVAKATHAVPAEEQTKRTKEVTKRLIIGSVLGAAAMVIAAIKLDGAALGYTLGGIMAALAAAWGYVSHVEKKQLPPHQE